MNLKDAIINLKKDLRSNLVEQINHITQEQDTTLVVILKSLLSSFLVCLGINFNQSTIIYIGLIMSPYSALFFLFSLSVYQKNLLSTLTAFKAIILGSLFSALTSIAYFILTPFAYDTHLILQKAQVVIYQYLALFILGISIDLFRTKESKLLFWVINIILSWPTMMVVIGFLSLQSDYISIYYTIIQYKLLFIAFFVGNFLLFLSLGIDKKSDENDRFHWIYSTIVISSIIYGFYFGYREISKQTTEFNVNQYLENGIYSKSFQVHNFIIDKSNKEINVFYTGIKPAATQEEAIKKKYHLSGYHFEYKEFK